MLVEFADLPPRTYADAYFELKQGLEDLLKRDVNLVTPPTLENPYFRREVEANKQTPLSAP